jgi:hypothetical protein
MHNEIIARTGDVLLVAAIFAGKAAFAIWALQPWPPGG